MVGDQLQDQKHEKKPAYIKQELQEYECKECKNTYKGKGAEENVKKHLEAIINWTSIEEDMTSGQAMGVLGMPMRNA